ncbi:hypothetical protein ACFWPX_01635 [Nocardia sp. NPDC058518]|uniref:hypothetical protein n=1 Tax=Nocardia sp. NPDC058518 TaxID=3346534 RepID=UPI00364FA994
MALAALAIMGSASVNIPGAEEYEALQRGTVDSAVNTLESILPYRFDEVIDSATTNARIGASLVVMAVSQDVFDGLPANVQKAMDEANTVAMASAAAATVKQRELGMEKTKGDVDYYELTAEQLAVLDPMLLEARQRWIDQREKNGDAGGLVVDAWRTALERAEVKASTTATTGAGK